MPQDVCIYNYMPTGQRAINVRLTCNFPVSQFSTSSDCHLDKFTWDCILIMQTTTYAFAWRYELLTSVDSVHPYVEFYLIHKQGVKFKKRSRECKRREIEFENYCGNKGNLQRCEQKCHGFRTIDRLIKKTSYTLLDSALENFAVGSFAVGNFAGGNFAVRKFRREEIWPWEVQPYGYFAIRKFRRKKFALWKFRRMEFLSLSILISK